jgi:hypothetical protein
MSPKKVYHQQDGSYQVQQVVGGGSGCQPLGDKQIVGHKDQNNTNPTEGDDEEVHVGSGYQMQVEIHYLVIADRGIACSPRQGLNIVVVDEYTAFVLLLPRSERSALPVGDRHPFNAVMEPC